MESLTERIKGWPSQPGVYLMRDSAKRILYVGKAKNLKNRIRSYFQSPEAIADKTRVLMKKVCDLEFTVTNTELEALLLECNLIKQHRPRYNIRLKDDKNFPYVVLDFTHPYPQFRITRKITNSPKLRYFGPFSGGVNEIGRFLLKTFQIRDCSDAKFKNRERPCLNYEIGTCTAPCVDYVTQEAYAKQIHEAVLFLKGKKRELLQRLKKEMSEASERMDYERARFIRDKIRAVETITEKQSAVLTEKQLDIDVIGCYEGEKERQWMVLFIRAGFLTGRRAEKTPSSIAGAEDVTKSFLEQFYSVSIVPDEIWIATPFPDQDELEKLLSQKANKRVRIRVRRSEKPMRLLGMAHENAKLVYLEGKKNSTVSASEQLREALDLGEAPYSIEGIDVSNIQGESPAIALVHFANERPLKSRYRLYYPKTVEGQNDFAMIYEVMQRRLAKLDENPPPDLFLIDGGKGQLQAALKALQEAGSDIPICSIAKARTERGFTLKEVKGSEERIFTPNRKNPIILREGHPALRLVQQVRDEAHRFSIKSHRQRRKKRTLADSPLLEISGVGPQRRKALLQKFGSFQGILDANVEELVAAGLPLAVAQSLKASAVGGGEE